MGIPTSVRLDPLFIGITDKTKLLKKLFEKLNEIGIKRIAVGYLFIRPKIKNNLKKLDNKDVNEMLDKYYKDTTKLTLKCGSSLPSLQKELRDKSFKKIKKIADKYGITPYICGCKNADIDSESRCNIAGDPKDIEDLCT